MTGSNPKAKIASWITTDMSACDRALSGGAWYGYYPRILSLKFPDSLQSRCQGGKVLKRPLLLLGIARLKVRFPPPHHPSQSAFCWHRVAPVQTGTTWSASTEPAFASCGLLPAR